MKGQETKQVPQDPNDLIDLVISLGTKLKEEKEKCTLLEEELDYLQDQADILKPLFTIKRVAKDFGLGKKKFKKWLIKKGFAHGDSHGDFVPNPSIAPAILYDLKDECEEYRKVHVFVTPYGREVFRLMLRKREGAKNKGGSS